MQKPLAPIHSRLTPVTLVTLAFIAILFVTEALWHWSLREPLTEAPVGTRRVMLQEMPRLKAKTWSAQAVLLGEAADTLRGRRLMLTAMRGDTLPQANDAGSSQLSAPSSRNSALPSVGDVLLVHGAIQQPRDTHNPGEMAYGTWLRRHGVSGTLFCYSDCWKRVGESPSLPWHFRLLRWREKMVQTYAAHFQGAELGVLAAMTVGDKSLLDAATRDDFSAVGASHILALSGLHLSILVTLFSFCLLRWLRRWRWAKGGAVFGGLLLMAAFVMLAGAPASLVRAAVMLGLALLCSLFERRGLSLNNLSLAALLILLYDPRTLFDTGFQLSFTAVAAIVVAVRRFPFPEKLSRWFSTRMLLVDAAREKIGREQLKEAMMTAPSVEEAQRLELTGFMPATLPRCQRLLISLRLRLGALCRLLWDMTVVSLAAQLATLPLVLYYFHTLPLWGLPLSFLVIPLAYLILLAAVLFFVLVPLRSVLAVVLKALLTALIGAVGGFADLPGGRLTYHWEQAPPFVIYSRPVQPELHCPSGQWQGDVLLSPYGRVARIDGKHPYGKPQQPLPVDYLWLCRGAKGHLTDWLSYYAPKTVVLDATLTPYYYNTYAHEADSLRLPVHDIRVQGALVISKK